MITVDQIRTHYETPWNAGEWGRHVTSMDGSSVEVPKAEDVIEVVAFGTDTWKEREVAIVKLADGRYCAWETSKDVTGSGFHADAYGGDADCWFARTLEVVLTGFAEDERELLEFA